MGGRRLIDETGMAPVNKEIIDMLTRMTVVLALALAGCEAADGVVMQDVAGPGGVTVTAPAAGQLQVSWSGDPAAFKINVFQSTAGGVFSLVGIVLNPSAQPPAPTSYVAVNLSGGVSYCYKVQAVYPDQSMSDLGAQGCGTATGDGSSPGTHTIAVDGTAFGPITSATTVSHQNGCTFSGGLGVRANLSLDQGHTVTAARFYITDNATGQTTLQGAIQTRSPTGSVLNGNITAGSDGSGGNQVLRTVRPTPIAVGNGYFLEVFYFSGSAPANISFVEVDYD